MKALAIGLVLALIGAPAFAQGFECEISGLIVDAAGQPRPNERLELAMTGSPLRQIAFADASGRFVYRNLGPGRYEVQMRIDDRVVARSEAIELSDTARIVQDVVVRPASWFPVARRVEPLPQRSAKELLHGGKPTQSFEALQEILKPGQEIYVRTAPGRATRGRVSSVSSNGLVLEGLERKWGEVWGSTGQERAFDAAAVRRIEVGDPLWNGVLIGAVGGIGFTAVSTWIACSPSCHDNFGWQGRMTVGFLAFVPAGAALGAAIDQLIRAPIYVRPGERPGVSLSPMLGPRQKGVAVRMDF